MSDDQTTKAARPRDAVGEVSRGHSRQFAEGPNLLAQGAVWDISMNVERQQGIMEQLSLFEQVGSVIRPVDFGEAGSGSETDEERQAFTAMGQQRALTYVKRLKETAVYVVRMPGGVRGGGREASPYSIWCSSG